MGLDDLRQHRPACPFDTPEAPSAAPQVAESEAGNSLGHDGDSQSQTASPAVGVSVSQGLSSRSLRGNEIEANDPPFYVYNPVFEDKVYQNEVLNLDVLFHSFKHADLLRKKATEVGLPFSGAYQEAPQEFIVRILTQ